MNFNSKPIKFSQKVNIYFSQVFSWTMHKFNTLFIISYSLFIILSTFFLALTSVVWCVLRQRQISNDNFLNRSSINWNRWSAILYEVVKHVYKRFSRLTVKVWSIVFILKYVAAISIYWYNKNGTFSYQTFFEE